MAVQRRKEEEQELNLTPIMNLVTILIPFLIMAAQFVNLAVIDSTLPAIGPPQPVEEEPEKPPPQPEPRSYGRRNHGSRCRRCAPS